VWFTFGTTNLALTATVYQSSAQLACSANFCEYPQVDIDHLGPTFMQFPMQATFKLLAFAPQVSLTDSNGRLILYVRQKLFKLKEAVTFFADSEQQTPVLSIKADRIIDFGASYQITTSDGRDVGSLKRKGMRSLWKATYEITARDGQLLTINETNPWVKVLDGVLGSLPIIGALTSYFLHPVYELSSDRHGLLFSFTKQPALWEGRYKIEQIKASDEATESLSVACIMMILLLERSRG
jgi:uncharacterized protein YxjI